MDEPDCLRDKQTNTVDDEFLDGHPDSNLSDWQKESQIPSGSMLLLSSANRYLEMERYNLQEEEEEEDQEMAKRCLEKYEEDLEAEDLSSFQAGLQEEEDEDDNNYLRMTDPLKDSMAYERPRRIHVPEHWKQYPLVIEGAIADSISHCQLSAHKLKQLSRAIKEIITTNISFPVAGKSHNLAFTTVQTYFHRTRKRLCRMLGEKHLPAVSQKLVTPATTYSQLLHEFEEICKPPAPAPLLLHIKKAKVSQDLEVNSEQTYSNPFHFPSPVELKRAFNSRLGNKKVKIPLHWNDYPKIVMGAIDASMELCKDRILKSQIKPAVIDVIKHRKKVVHCKNAYQVAHTSLRRYVYYACHYLLRCLGANGVNPTIAPFINSSTTYKQVHQLFSSKTLPSTTTHSQSADMNALEEEDVDDLENEDRMNAQNGICLAVQDSLQSANLLTHQGYTSFKRANAWEQMEQEEVDYKPFVLSPGKTVLNRPIVRIAEEDFMERNSVSSANSSGLRLPSLAKNLPKFYDREETLEKSRKIQDLIRAGRFISCISVIESNFPEFMEDQKELGLFLKIQKLVEQSLQLKKIYADEDPENCIVKSEANSSRPLLQTIDQGLAENVSKKIINEADPNSAATIQPLAEELVMSSSSAFKPAAVQKCELLSDMGQIAKTIASLLLEGKAHGNIAANSLKEASQRVNDAFSVILNDQSSKVPQRTAYLMASSQWEKLADFFNIALFTHTKLQLSLDLFKN